MWIGIFFISWSHDESCCVNRRHEFNFLQRMLSPFQSELKMRPIVTTPSRRYIPLHPCPREHLQPEHTVSCWRTAFYLADQPRHPGNIRRSHHINVCAIYGAAAATIADECHGRCGSVNILVVCTGCIAVSRALECTNRCWHSQSPTPSVFDGVVADETARFRSEGMARCANDSVEYNDDIRYCNDYLEANQDHRAVGQRPRATWVSKV